MKSRHGHAKRRVERTTTLREIVTSLSPIVKELREIEDSLTGVNAQFAAVPDDVDEAAGPDALLRKLAERLDRRFAAVVGKPEVMEITPPDVREVLDAARRLADCVARGTTTDARTGGAPRRRIWVEADLYIENPDADKADGEFHGRRKLDPDLRLSLGDLEPDGSLTDAARRRLRAAGVFDAGFRDADESDEVIERTGPALF